MPRKLTVLEVMQYLKKFDLELISDEYNGVDSKIKIKCKCGDVFETTLNKVKHRNKRTCNKCVGLERINIHKVIEYVKNNSSCELISSEVKSVDSNLMFRCECGEIFKRTFYNFKKYEKRCPKCRESEKSLNMSLNYEYVKNYIESYGAKLLSNEYVNAKTRLDIQCECGRKFKADFDKIKSRSKVRCNVCSKKTSSKEFIISQKLETLNIKHIEQYKFDDCIYKDKLIFDFYIPSLNTCIEYDGEGHYEPFRFSKNKEAMQKKLEETKIRDTIKTQYCKDNNIKLIRIPYFEFDNIDEILKCLL